MMLLDSVSHLDGHMKDTEPCGMIGDGRFGTVTLWTIEHQAKGAQAEKQELYMCRNGLLRSFVFECNPQHYQYVYAHCYRSCIHLCSPVGHLRLYTSMGAVLRHPSTRTWGLDDDDDEIKGLGKGRVDKGYFRLGERCVGCLGRDLCLTNVAWDTGYWKQGHGFLPGHEFLGWCFGLIGQLDHFSAHISTKEDAVSFFSAP